MNELKDQLKTKKDSLENFQKTSKEMKEQRRIEIENLKNAKGEMKQDKYTKKEALKKKAEQIAEQHKVEHKQRCGDLDAAIEELEA